MVLQTIILEGKQFVIVEKRYFDTLRRRSGEIEQGDLPPLPPPDAQGCRPALDFMRASIARDLARERKAAGLSQQQLAKLAGVRQETLSRLETGKHTPTPRIVEKIDAALAKARRRSGK